MKPGVDCMAQLIDEIIPSITEAYVVQVAASSPKELRRAKQAGDTVNIIIPVPNNLIEGVDLKKLTVERFQESLVSPFKWWLKKVRVQTDGAIKGNDEEIVFDLFGQDMIALHFDFSIPYGIFDAEDDDDDDCEPEAEGSQGEVLSAC